MCLCQRRVGWCSTGLVLQQLVLQPGDQTNMDGVSADWTGPELLRGLGTCCMTAARARVNVLSCVRGGCGARWRWLLWDLASFHVAGLASTHGIKWSSLPMLSHAPGNGPFWRMTHTRVQVCADELVG
jgi:hypothetical protein